LRINPDAPHVLFLKGSALMQLGSYEEALEWGAPLSPDSCVSQLL
jgi:hypothetical protein